MKTKRFKLAGTVIDVPAINRMRSQWESMLADEMSRKGFVRNYDQDPVFRTTKEDIGFAWELYMDGVYAGKRAQSLAGMANGRFIPKGKSKQQLTPAG